MHLQRTILCFFVLIVAVPLSVAVSIAGAQDAEPNAKGANSDEAISTLMAIPNEVVLDEDFSKPKKLEKSTWLRRQGTRWAIEGGVLRGQESSKEFQAAREHHFGYEPRLSIPVTPQEFVCSFSIRFIDGKETAIVPFVEFGHHVCRIRFSKEGTTLLSDGETMKLAESKTFVWESGKWYRAVAEMKGDEFLMRIADGPTFYAQRASFATPPKSGGNGLGVAGPKHGFVELNDLKIWSVKSEFQKGWEKTKATFEKFEPVQIKEPKKKKA